jgi:hypothetical protein
MILSFIFYFYFFLNNLSFMNYFLFVLFCSLTTSFTVFSQGQIAKNITGYEALSKCVKDEYGLDQLLVNGRYYEDMYLKKVGHPFLLQEQLSEGSILYRGNEYARLQMNYNIYDQELVVLIENNNEKVKIVPLNDFVTTFSIHNKYFAKYNLEGEPKFYQVVFDSEKIRCLYFWSKRKNEFIKDNKYNYFEFSGVDCKRILVVNGKFATYKNNKSFIGLFPVNMKESLSQYLKNGKIKISMITDEEMVKLLEYCNTLL